MDATPQPAPIRVSAPLCDMGANAGAESWLNSLARPLPHRKPVQNSDAWGVQ